LSFLACSIVQVHGQNKTDSLFGVVNLKKYDTSMVNALAKLSKEFLLNNPSKAIWYANKGRILAEYLDYKKGIAICKNSKGDVYYIQSNYEKALENYQKSIILYYKLNDKNNYAAGLKNIGNIYARQSNYLMAISYYQKSVKIFETIDDKKGMWSCYNNLGNIYFFQSNFEKAIEYYQKSVKICTEIGDKKGILSCYNNIGNIQSQQKKYSAAMEYYLHSLKIANELDDKTSESACYQNIGSVQRWLGNFSLAINNYQKSLKIREELGDKQGIGYNYVILAELNNSNNNYNKAIEYAKKALSLAKEIGSLDLKQYAYEYLTDSYKGLGNYKEALNQYELYTQINDTIYNIEKNSQIVKMEEVYQSEKKQNEIELLNQKNNSQKLLLIREKEKKRNLIISSISILCFVIIFFLFLYSRYKHSQKIALSKSLIEQQKLRYSAVIDAEEKERKRIAEDLHDSLGQMISTARLNISSIEDDIKFEDKDDYDILNTAIGLLDESCQEIRNISYNIMPNALIKLGLIPAIEELVNKINKSLQIKILINTSDFEERISETYEIAVYRIIQEIISNIIKHAGATIVNIDITKSKGQVKLCIHENGKGFDTSNIEKSSGLGWKNIYSRTIMMNGELTVFSKPGMGTTINFSFPIIT